MIQRAGTALPQHTLPGTEAMVFPRPDITGSRGRGAGLSMPPTAAQPWAMILCCGFLPASSADTVGPFCNPKQAA